MDLQRLVDAVRDWHYDRNLIEGSTNQAQVVKLLEETGELAKSISRSEDIRDDIGDILVVLINLAERERLSLEDCLTVAYNDIKDRKGTMVDGVFVKEEG